MIVVLGGWIELVKFVVLFVGIVVEFKDFFYVIFVWLKFLCMDCVEM